MERINKNLDENLKILKMFELRNNEEKKDFTIFDYYNIKYIFEKDKLTDNVDELFLNVIKSIYEEINIDIANNRVNENGFLHYAIRQYYNLYRIEAQRLLKAFVKVFYAFKKYDPNDELKENFKILLQEELFKEIFTTQLIGFNKKGVKRYNTKEAREMLTKNDPLKRLDKYINEKLEDSDKYNAIDSMINTLIKDISFKNDDIMQIEAKYDNILKEIEDYNAQKLKNLTFNDYINLFSLDNKTKNYFNEKKEEYFIPTNKILNEMANIRGEIFSFKNDPSLLVAEKKKLEESIIKASSELEKEEKEVKLEEIKKLQEEQEKQNEELEELKEVYKQICEQIESDTVDSSEYKIHNKQAKEIKKRIDTLQHKFTGFQLDLYGYATYEKQLKNRESIKLAFLSDDFNRQIARLPREVQDMNDFIFDRYLHNTEIENVDFTLREYEDLKKRSKPTRYLSDDIATIRYVFREIWSYYEQSNKWSFTEEHLFKSLRVEGEEFTDKLEPTITLDTKISITPSEILKLILTGGEIRNAQYIKTNINDLYLSNTDNKQYYAKILNRYFKRIKRINASKNNVIIDDEGNLTIKLKNIIELLQHYGLKKYFMLNKDYTFKKEIVNVIDESLKVLEGDNRLNKKHIEVIDLSAFIDYEDKYNNKLQEEVIKAFEEETITIKVLDIDEEDLKRIKDNKKYFRKNKKKKS